jgi:hypothetical protein
MNRTARRLTAATAQAERAMALWPNKGDRDPRPALGAAYQRIATVAPGNPAVPSSAPAALRLHPSRSPGRAVMTGAGLARLAEWR